MPTSWHFPRWRFFTLQILMCLILAATIGLAAFVDYGLRKVQGNLLAEPTVDGDLAFRLPAGWKFSARGNGHWSARSPAASGELARIVDFHRQRIDRMMSPKHYLEITGQSTDGAEGASAILIDDKWPGELMQIPGFDLTSKPPTETQSIVACAVLPNRDAITVRLEKAGPMDKSDYHLASLLINSIKISGLGEATSGPFEMDGGIKVSLSSDYHLLPESDPLRTERFVYTDFPDGKRVSIQMIPFVLPANKPIQSAQTALTNHEMDPRDFNLSFLHWLEATVTPEAPDRWRIDPAQARNDPIARRAYLMGTPAGQGILISMQSDVGNDAELDSAWAAVSGAVEFTQPMDLKALLAAGAPVAQLPGQMDALEKSWLLWQRNGVAEGSVYNSTDPEHQLLKRQSLRREWDGAITEVDEDWGVGNSGVESAKMVRSFRNPEPSSPAYVLFRSSTVVTDVISTELGIRIAEIPSEITPVTPDFVFNARLPALLASIATGPLAFTADRFIGAEGELLPQPIVLLVNRSDKYVQVEVNGSGQLSRWYFEADGSLDRAEFAGGLSLKPSNPGEIDAALSDPRLTPRLTRPQ